MRKSNFKWEIKIINLDSISSLKKKIEKIKLEFVSSEDKIRLFFGGKELQDNKRLCDYNIEDGNFIQML